MDPGAPFLPYQPQLQPSYSQADLAPVDTLPYPAQFTTDPFPQVGTTPMGRLPYPQQLTSETFPQTHQRPAATQLYPPRVTEPQHPTLQSWSHHVDPPGQPQQAIEEPMIAANQALVLYQQQPSAGSPQAVALYQEPQSVRVSQVQLCQGQYQGQSPQPVQTKEEPGSPHEPTQVGPTQSPLCPTQDHTQGQPSSTQGEPTHRQPSPTQVQPSQGTIQTKSRPSFLKQASMDKPHPVPKPRKKLTKTQSLDIPQNTLVKTSDSSQSTLAALDIQKRSASAELPTPEPPIPAIVVEPPGGALEPSVPSLFSSPKGPEAPKVRPRSLKATAIAPKANLERNLPSEATNTTNLGPVPNSVAPALPEKTQKTQKSSLRGSPNIPPKEFFPEPTDLGKFPSPAAPISPENSQKSSLGSQRSPNVLPKYPCPELTKTAGTSQDPNPSPPIPPEKTQKSPLGSLRRPPEVPPKPPKPTLKASRPPMLHYASVDVEEEPEPETLSPQPQELTTSASGTFKSSAQVLSRFVRVWIIQTPGQFQVLWKVHLNLHNVILHASFGIC